MERVRTQVGARLRVVDVQVYHWLDSMSGMLIGCMLVFSPWAFGTTEEWSIAVMNIAGYGLGAMLIIKLTIRGFRGYRPPRWETAADGWQLRALASLTVLMLGYCLLSAVNARAIWHAGTSQFQYRPCVLWLPHSLDGHASWQAFARYLGLAASYWAIRDWLLGKTAKDIPTMDWAGFKLIPGANVRAGAELPRRVEALLTVVMMSGTLLAFESILQRELDSPKLLFLVQPRIHLTAITQWGPFAYRANGAQYFNLLWPVCLGCWWSRYLRSHGDLRRHYHWLVAAVLLAACPIISSSRAGALVAVGMLVTSAGVLAALSRSNGLGEAQARAGLRGRKRAILVYLALVICVAGGLGWKSLRPRLGDWKTAYGEREAAYQYATQIAADYPIFGTGPGTYESVSDLYRPITGEFWPAQLHNDWLETRITFGWLGSSLIYLALALAFLSSAGKRPPGPDGVLVMLVQLAMAGCLLHARWDFPFQVHSILFLFLVWCALLPALNRRPTTGRVVGQARRSMPNPSEQAQDGLAAVSRGDSAVSQ